MSEDFNKERVLARVQKMLRLANDAAASEGERDNALRMAHATLAKYNLSMAEAEATGTAPTEGRQAGQFELREYAWMRGVAHAVGELFFCLMFFRRTQVKHATYVFIGKESNVYTAVEMTRYVLHSIDTEGMRQARNRGEAARGNYWRSFCKGAAARISQRCQELIKAAQQQMSEDKAPGTALVLASVYQSERKANEIVLRDKMGINLRTHASRQHRPSADGFYAGVAYGNQIQLNKQIGRN